MEKVTWLSIHRVWKWYGKHESSSTPQTGTLT